MPGYKIYRGAEYDLVVDHIRRIWSDRFGVTMSQTEVDVHALDELFGAARLHHIVHRAFPQTAKPVFNVPGTAMEQDGHRRGRLRFTQQPGYGKSFHIGKARFQHKKIERRRQRQFDASSSGRRDHNLPLVPLRNGDDSPCVLLRWLDKQGAKAAIHYGFPHVLLPYRPLDSSFSLHTLLKRSHGEWRRTLLPHSPPAPGQPGRTSQGICYRTA